MVDASPNANACRLKKWEPLSSSVSPIWKGLFWPSGAGSYFFPLQKDREPERCTCHPFWNSTFIDLVTRNGIYRVMCFVFFFLYEHQPISALKMCLFYLQSQPYLQARSFTGQAMHARTRSDTHTSHSCSIPACPPSLHPGNSTYCLKYVLIKFSDGFCERNK